MIRLSKCQSDVVHLRHYIGVRGFPIIRRLRKRHTHVARRSHKVIVVCDCVNGRPDLSQRTLP